MQRPAEKANKEMRSVPARRIGILTVNGGVTIGPGDVVGVLGSEVAFALLVLLFTIHQKQTLTRRIVVADSVPHLEVRVTLCRAV